MILYLHPLTEKLASVRITYCNDSIAQLVEHNTFNVGVLGSSPSRVTKELNRKIGLFLCLKF